MKSPRFLFVLGVGQGPEAHPIWPDVHQPFAGDLRSDETWVAWRLTGANHRELGRSARVYPDLAGARSAALYLRGRLAQAEVTVSTVGRTGTWGWRLQLDGGPVATSSRGYARHRECTYNVNAFLAAAAIAATSESDPPLMWRLAEPRVVEQSL